MRGRIYDPTTGRMLTPDPVVGGILSAGAWNPYSYVSNSVVSATDPTGYLCDGCDGPPPWQPPLWPPPLPPMGGSGGDSGSENEPLWDTGLACTTTGGGEQYCEIIPPAAPQLTPEDYKASSYAGAQWQGASAASGLLPQSSGSVFGGYTATPTPDAYGGRKLLAGITIGGPDLVSEELADFMELIWNELTRPPPSYMLCTEAGCQQVQVKTGTPPMGPGVLKAAGPLLRGASTGGSATARAGVAAEKSVSKSTGIARNVGAGRQTVPGTGPGGFRIPDLAVFGPNASATLRGSIIEVKNVSRLSGTRQIQDLLGFARGNGLRLEIFSNARAPKRGILADAIRSGDVILRRIP